MKYLGIGISVIDNVCLVIIGEPTIVEFVDKCLEIPYSPEMGYILDIVKDDDETIWRQAVMDVINKLKFYAPTNFMTNVVKAMLCNSISYIEIIFATTWECQKYVHQKIYNDNYPNITQTTATLGSIDNAYNAFNIQHNSHCIYHQDHKVTRFTVNDKDVVLTGNLIPNHDGVIGTNLKDTIVSHIADVLLGFVEI